jgi:hypothetical protein
MLLWTTLAALELVQRNLWIGLASEALECAITSFIVCKSPSSMACCEFRQRRSPRSVVLELNCRSMDGEPAHHAKYRSSTSNIAGNAAIAIVCLFGAALFSLLLFYAGSPWLDRQAIPFLGSRPLDSGVFALAAAVTGYVTVSLALRKTWAWWLCLAIAIMTLCAALWLLFATLHPRDDFARSEGGFGFFISLCFIILGLSSSALLMLPQTRRRFE